MTSSHPSRPGSRPGSNTSGRTTGGGEVSGVSGVSGLDLRASIKRSRARRRWALLLGAFGGLLIVSGLIPDRVPTRAVVVASSTIGSSTVLTESELSVVQWPIPVPIGSYESIDALLGRSTGRRLEAGDVVRVSDATSLIGPDQVSFPVSLLEASQAELLEAGSVVDVFRDGLTVAQGAAVSAITARESGTTTVWVVVDQEGAELLSRNEGPATIAFRGRSP